ncbi:MAG: putative rane protein [Chloroflexota bacterium]|nr:putative rane protein [Chloroflexota bacterium]
MAASGFRHNHDCRKMRGVTTVALVLIGATALLHLWFLVLEMFLWRTPFGMRTFGTTPETADATATLATNQGLYNGILAAGLGWSLVAPEPTAFAFRVFFLGAVIVAGIYGGITVSRRILLVQALPAALALGAVLLA